MYFTRKLYNKVTFCGLGMTQEKKDYNFEYT